jgi:hypothetical protein
MDPPTTTVPLAIDFGNFIEDIYMDMGNIENNTASSGNSFFSECSPSRVEEEQSITGHNFNSFPAIRVLARIFY